jgi:hypothetical protein
VSVKWSDPDNLTFLEAMGAALLLFLFVAGFVALVLVVAA